MGSTAWWIAGTLATLAAVGLVALLVRGGARPYETERALAAQLARTGRPAQAEVLALDRQPGGELYAAPMKLALRYADAMGRARQAELHVYIDSELLVNFMPGQAIHVRFDPSDAARIAVDRERSPTEIPAAWRRRHP
ncbi:DUF3592 domain-containing protein [Bordetella bronchiseptica]|uniref:N-acetyltransferase YedL n=3 Tax=Bordetella bronchiseptica TaxID=518 RepID=A0ABR4R8W2_BORBO|nr:DUF3592 domain-containing protein [Bordetella bronchiseptica]SHT45660.1 Uncharacterised protein [Mycobacteroides abscessus subsp. abscessus]AWP73649.1 DUF3592 domain-containing protein [Bordetella bronchiseptica]AZW11197.1 DUF3592 domain-containing protein [Bordetella bronchiseptica]AZW20459.1 DUF3592 domain-containing protein [Bordetella bronchiseptica]KAB1446649.1 DUF3592 domain-containing protein [Bordetella bronchiseptica]